MFIHTAAQIYTMVIGKLCRMCLRYNRSLDEVKSLAACEMAWREQRHVDTTSEDVVPIAVFYR